MNAFLKSLQERKRLVGTAALLVVAVLAGTYYLWQRSGPPVPLIPLEGQDKKVAEAVTEARAAVVKNPRSADAWGHLGQVLLANEIFPDIGLTCFLEAERLDPAEPRWPYFAAGYLSVNLAKPEEAVVKLQRAVALGEGGFKTPSSPRLLLAEMLQAVGKTDESAGHFKHVLADEPNDPRAHFGLGLLAYSRGDWQECRKHLEACVGNPFAQKKACIQLATVCDRLNDKAGADKYATLAAQLPKDFDWPDRYASELFDLAKRKRDKYRAVENLEAQREFRQAAAILWTMTQEDPDEYLPHLMMGRILPQMGRLEEAEDSLLKARKLAPDKIQVHYLLSLVLLNKGVGLSANPLKAKAFFEESVKSARHALTIRPDYGNAYLALGLALKNLDQRADALAAFRQAVHCSPEHAENHLQLGLALAAEGNVREARIALEQARLLAPPQDVRAKTALDKLP